uniref:Leucine zipper transcription factor-like protein 1 n=1 Tax=Chlamydomonas leiostraca TaxID=1034604 RepID=A0A7S0WQH0_9CHLO|mmetsp:Transcript_23393/g.59892  ORF Transcript_23393/g.59892 Transcript_23393/m.59892 type:complete len:329 (+) Transcript_23393:76-1062(+)|eukprot:CAMPEP_0202866754 /NCGR_PEP_ID=MMETSP1391-20130828/8343_1 /ASSEMBLY_ACC=CAM_ASM_000867 /TAXON_ID=1034604 /ORGANISM="Chlamydomonas leiostraca, Strain SAG 11-49" /LENGTH=328 /DNA_ID=CAMNT_0049546735 /DNA_START=53 /DNA_END=1039 /DNA_ORIENTATION=-
MTSINLSEEHELQVQAYLRFAKLKRDQHVRETVSVVHDFKEEKLQPGEMYNYRDLVGLVTEMEEEVRSLVDKEVQHAYHTNALLVKILLSQAQANGLELHVDTNALENEFLLRQIAHSEETALSRPASDFVRRNAQLSKLGTVATVAVTDTTAVREKEAMAAELGGAQDRMRALQEQMTAAMREKTALTNQLNALKEELATKDAALSGAQSGQTAMLGKLQHDFASLSTEAAGAAAASNAQFGELQKQLNEHRGMLESTRRELAGVQEQLGIRESELRHAHDILDGKLQEAPQFQQMRKMMQAKSQEVVDLRRRLARYEPQSVPSADA